MIRLLTVLMIGSVCVGCGDGGPPLGKVQGTVTMDGNPLPSALVTFMPEKSKGSGLIDE